MRRTIFHDLTSENENTTTQVLANLMQNKTIRDSIIKIIIPNISDEVLNTFNSSSISTQKRIGAAGQPDLVIKSNASFIIIENKIRQYTPPTDHEVDDYIELINNSSESIKCLVFLIPPQYRFIQYFLTLVEHNKHCIIVYWDFLMEELKKKELAEISPLFKESLDFLEQLIFGNEQDSLHWGIYEVAMLYNNKDLFAAFKTTSLIHSLLYKSEALLVPQLEGMGIGKIWPSNWFPENYEVCYGKYLTVNNKQFLYFGFSNLSDNDDYSFGIAIDSQIEKHCNVILNRELMVSDSEGWYYYPIDRKLLLENDPSILANAFAKAFIQCMHVN